MVAVERSENSTYEVCLLKVSFFSMINYTYIVRDRESGRAALVDPAWEIDVILEACDSLGVQPDKILLTHSHYDHVNLTHSLVDRFGCQVYMSAREVEQYGFRCRHLHVLDDSEVIRLGATTIRCLVTPGHTAGGVCYALSDSLFTGDTIFIEGCGMCDPNGGSPEELFDSVQRIKRHVEPHVRIYPGHSYGKEPGVALADVIKQNIYFQLEKKEHFVNFRMRKNQKNLFAFK